MKALYSIAAGGPETLVLGELADPVAGPGELLVSVAACAINYPDVLIIEDRYQFRPARPFAPGSEVAGTVLAVGEGVSDWAPGDRAIATMTSGGLADKAVVDANNAFRLPDAHGFVEGAALLLTYATAIHALADRGRLERGQSLLVLGAGGGVGLAAVEVGKALGARVVAAVSTTEKATAATKAGADNVVVYGKGARDRDEWRTLSTAFKAAAGPEGFDTVLDPVGGDFAEAALRATGWGGRYLVVGFPAGIPAVPFNVPLLKGCDICGVFMGAFATRDPVAHRRNVARLFDWWREGKINPLVTATYPLAKGGDALARMAARGAVGKLVVTIDQGP